MAGAQGVGGDPGAVEAGGDGAVPEHTGDGMVAKGLVADAAGPGSGEQRPRLRAALLEPRGEGGDGVGGGVGAVGDGDDLAVSFLGWSWTAAQSAVDRRAWSRGRPG